MKRFLKITGGVLLCVLLLCVGLTFSLRIPAVQNYVAHLAVNYLSNKLGTKVSLKRFEWNLFRNIDLREFYMADKKGDTLIYAGSLNVDVSYWSLTQKQFKIKSISLENAKVRLRADSSGNLNLLDLFGSAKKDTTVKTGDTVMKPMNLIVSLQKVGLDNTDFIYEDRKKHLLVRVAVPTCVINMNQLALEKKLIDIHTINIDGVRAWITVLQKDESTPPPPAKIRFMPPGWELRWDKIALVNSTFAYNDVNKAEKNGSTIDFAHLLLSDINIYADTGRVVRDSIKADLSSLRTREKSGFEIKQLASILKVSTTEIGLKNLALQTSNSYINTFIGFSYSDFEDFNDFAEKITVKADLRKASLSLLDLNYFFKGMDKVSHNTINVSGKIDGQLTNLKAKDLVITTGRGTYIKGNFYTKGLPNLQETSLNLRIEQFSTSSEDIRYIYPSDLYPPGFDQLGHIRFNGDFDGFISDFVTRGSLVTDIGSATSDLNFKYNIKTNKSAYSGQLSLHEFDLGKWFNDTVALGKVSLTANVEGGGLKRETINAKLQGDISSLTIKGYNYKDVNVNGLVKGKFFSGNLVVKDQNLDADFTGTVDLTGKLPRYNFASSIRTARLRELHLLKDTLNLSGEVTADFSGKKPDDMVGSLLLNNINVMHGHESATIRNITASSDILTDGSKEIKIKSDNLEARIAGRFSFAGLPRALRRYVNYTFTKFYEDTAIAVPEQFVFEIRAYDTAALVRVIDPRFHVLRNSVLSGELNTVNHILNIKGTIPELVYDKYMIKNFAIDGTSRDGKIDVVAAVGKLYVSDSLMIDTFASHSFSEGDEFRFDLAVADANHYNRAGLTAYLKPLKSSAEIRLLPSEVWLGGNKWSFGVNNKIVVKGRQITTDSIIFASGDQALRIRSYLKNDTSTSIDLTMRQTSLGDFLNIFHWRVKDLQATVNGQIKVEDVFGKPAPIADIELSDVYFGKIYVGKVKVNSTLESVEKKVIIDVTVQGGKNDIAISGNYDLARREITLNTNIRSVDLDILNHPLFVKYVKNVTGTAGARLDIHGPLNALVMIGKVKVHKAKVTVSFINTTYTLEDQDIEVGDGYFDMGTISIVDRFNHIAYGRGRIYHDHFKKITLDLHVNGDNMEVLNTTIKDIPQFYGEGIVRGTVDFLGTLPLVTIRAYAQTRANTHCYIPISNSYETSRYSFYRFVNPQKDTIKLKRKEDVKLSGLNFILDLEVTPDAILDIVLDPSAGDILSSRGSGDMRVEILRTGEFNIYGRYEIQQGNYLFTMQNLVNKHFELDPGGSITFRGDVYNAQLNADAVYHVTTSTYDLISDLLAANGYSETSEQVLRSKNRIGVDLLLKLKGVLQTPEVSFDIRPQDPDALIRTYVDNKIQLMRATETEMNKQAFGLLVMKRFLPTTSGGASDPLTRGSSLGNSAANTVSEFLSSQLSLYLGSFFDNINLKDFDVGLNYKQYDQQYTNGAVLTDNLNTRRELQLELTKRFFNSRLSINVGGNLDFGDNNTVAASGTTSKSTYVTGDFQIEYVLDKKGAWRAKTYNKNDYDNYRLANRNKTGVGISYRQDFDKWKDLFRRRGKKPIPMPLPRTDTRPEDAPKVDEAK